MKKLRKINIEDNLAQMFLICSGLYVGTTGILLFEVEFNQGTKGVYSMLAKLLSLDAWGVVLIVSGLLLIASAFQKEELKFLSMLIGGMSGGTLLMLYGIASFDYNPYLSIGARYIVVGAFMLIIASLGGRELWIKRYKRGE